MDVRFRPLVWTGPRTPAGKRRSRWTFKAGYQDTLYKLEYEIEYLKGTEIVIEADFREDQIRIDGWPRANTNPGFQGVKVSFNQPGVGRVEYATDVCEIWQHNLRSIALGLEALRAVDRYGITAGKQQYTGFKAIESSYNGFITREQAAAWIADMVAHRAPERQPGIRRALLGLEPTHEDPKKVLREAALKLHPDQNSGQDSLWRKFEDAKKVLGIS